MGESSAHETKKVPLKIVPDSLERKLYLSFILLSVFSYIKIMTHALVFDLFIIQHIGKDCLYPQLVLSMDLF